MGNKSQWRQEVERIIDETRAEFPDAKGNELKRVLRSRYPFGERKYHPYKIWLSAVNEACNNPYKPVTQMSLRDYWTK